MTDVYFNENDRFPSWLLGRLFPDARVDTRSICDVRPEDIVSCRRCHFFGGIGGWELALRYAGWPAGREVWTGSCPCQPFSQAGKGLGEDDPRHLWPQFLRLIRERSPATIFGEQVASKLGREWVSGVRVDLEALGYAVGISDLCAAGVGAPHIRQRLFWVADSSSAKFGRRTQSDNRSGESFHPANGGGVSWVANRGQQSSRTVIAGGCITASHTASARGFEEISQSGRCRVSGGLPNATGVRGAEQQQEPRRRSGSQQEHATEYPRSVWVGDCGESRLSISESEAIQEPGRREQGRATEQSGLAPTPWSEFRIVPCLDGKSRRIPTVESGVLPLAYGVPNRVGRLRGYGNAIVPQIAAIFVKSFLETEYENTNVLDGAR